ncbi:hypothetical protein D3Z36_07445 [Lachnospiraceae bacterium]|nr:hypothetical protein [Lachnospiraceae bacterium]
MRIDSVSNNMNMGMQTRMAQGMDATSKNIQNQIQAKQQELQKLSENEDKSLEDKMKKRQEIQKEISDLNMQLRQHQIEQRREQQQNKGASMDDMLGGKQQARKSPQNGQSTGLSQASTKAMISADSSMKQAAVHGSVATSMEGRAGVLEAEIKQDGGDVEAKKIELADVNAKAERATASQMSTIGDANAAMEEAREAESESSKTESTKKTPDKAKAEGQEEAENTEQTADVQGTEIQNADTAQIHTESDTVTLPGNYTPVDIRL